MREPQVVGQTTSVSRFFVSRIETHKSVGQDMSTLINEPFHEEEATSSCVGMTPYTFPKAENTQTGESVDYVPSSDKQWYVLRASFGREENVSQYLTADGTYNYVARRYTWIADRHGHPRQHLESLLPSILFAYATRQKVEQYVRHTPTLPYITYYYDTSVWKSTTATHPSSYPTARWRTSSAPPTTTTSTCGSCNPANVASRTTR